MSNQTTPPENTTPLTPKEWANPTPAGLVALAVACFCFFAMLNGYLEASGLKLIGCWLLGGFVVQLVVGLLDLKSGNLPGGNTFLFFSAFFMLVGGLEMLVKADAIAAGNPADGLVDGYAWLALTVVLLLWTPAFCKKFTLLSLIVLALDVALPFITLIDLRVLSADWKPVPAYALLISGVIAIYFSAALVVNGTFGKKVYPVL